MAVAAEFLGQEKVAAAMHGAGSPDALDANRGGQLTPEQAEAVRSSIDNKHSGITGLVAAAAERAASPRGRDLAEGRVDSVEGPFRKRWWQNYGRIAGANYRFVIETREAWAKQGAEPLVMTPAEFDKYIRADIDKWAKVIQTAGIKVQ